MIGWLAMRGVEARKLDVTQAAGLASAAELELADLEMVPVLAFFEDGRELARYVGTVPKPLELRRLLNLNGVGNV